MLDLARMARPDDDAHGEDVACARTLPTLKAVASLHGILTPILPGAGGDSKVADDAPVSVPRVLVLHAAGDPFVPPEQVRHQ